MLKQSPSKSPRSKGFKIKNVLQICVLLAICIWLLHQVKHTYEKKKAYKEGDADGSSSQGEYGGLKLGRKDLHSQIQQTVSEMNTHIENAEFEAEENKNGDEQRGGVTGEDEMEIGRDEEKLEEEETEEVEDLIDEEDREKEDETEEQEREELEENLLENESVFANEAEKYSQDASDIAMQKGSDISDEFAVGLGGLRK